MDIIVVTMFIKRNTKKQNQSNYHSTLLVESYREEKKVKHRTICNLSSWPEELVNRFEILLKGGQLSRIEDLNISQGKAYGGIKVIYEIAERLGISSLLGKSKRGLLVLVMIMARILTQGSRLRIVSWIQDEAIEEVLGPIRFDEDDWYETLDWLATQQGEIEDQLFGLREQVGEIFLYDVTSTYFEGDCNELAEYGYNRDKKKGKKQMVIGLMTDQEGYPICVEVFRGNTQDPQTVIDQIKKIAQRFGVERVILVGDRGMLKSVQIKEITALHWHFITAITKPQIEGMITKGILQLGLFEETIGEIEYDGHRYIFRQNSARAQEIAKNRQERINWLIKKIEKKNQYLTQHPRASIKTALSQISKEAAKRRLSKIITLNSEDRTVVFSLNQEEIFQQARLDGCYCLKTDLPVHLLEKAIVHDRYKDLAQIERAFRTMKTALLEIRPVYLRKEERTRAHVFICMLGYMITHYIWQQVNALGYDQDFVFQTLEKIQYSNHFFESKSIKLLPQKFTYPQQQILSRLDIKFPRSL